MISINRLIIVLPEPTTALKSTVDTDIHKVEIATNFTEGKAVAIRTGSFLNQLNIWPPKSHMHMLITPEYNKLREAILRVRYSTRLCFPCPIILLTIVLVVAAKAHKPTHAVPYTLLIIWEAANSVLPKCST